MWKHFLFALSYHSTDVTIVHYGSYIIDHSTDLIILHYRSYIIDHSTLSFHE